MLQNLPLDTVRVVMQFLNLAEVRICLGKVNRVFQKTVKQIENRHCSTPHKFLHQVSKCTCQVFTDFSLFCHKIMVRPTLQTKLSRVKAIQHVHEQMKQVPHWDNVVLQSYIQTGHPRIATCSDPFLVSLVASKNSCELELLLECYTLYGVQGLKENFLFAFSNLKTF